jgi:hypothetical protein
MEEEWGREWEREPRKRKRNEEEEENKAEKLCLRYYYLSPFPGSSPSPHQILGNAWLAGSIDIGACLPMITHVIGAARFILRRRSRSLFLGDGGSFWLFFFFLLIGEGKGWDGMGWDGVHFLGRFPTAW